MDAGNVEGVAGWEEEKVPEQGAQGCGQEHGATPDEQGQNDHGEQVDQGESVGADEGVEGGVERSSNGDGSHCDAILAGLWLEGRSDPYLIEPRVGFVCPHHVNVDVAAGGDEAFQQSGSPQAVENPPPTRLPDN